MLLVILLPLLLNSTASYAAISPSSAPKNELEVPFYKSVDSLFPSGFTNIENLKRSQISTKNKTDRYYKWQKLFFSQDELKPIFPVHLSRYVIDQKSNSRLKVIETNSKSILTSDNSQQIVSKKLITDVAADPYDLGYVMSLKDIYLKDSANTKSKTLTTIPQGIRLIAEKYTSKYALVAYQNYKGYVHISDLITKFDFSTFVFANNEWHQVRSRNFDVINTEKNQTISLNDIKGLITPDNKGIIASTSQKLPIWSQVEISLDKISVWNESELKEHGRIWWKSNSEIDEQVTYTIDEILKKDISSVSFHPQNPLKGILSSNGVFTTQDGYRWKKIKQFEEFNGPVHYFNDHLIFVGNFRSTDGGKTFDNYIKVEKLASAIEFQFGFTPKKLQVKKIETKAPFRLKLEIETDHRNIKLESPLFSQDWTASKS